MKATIKTKNPYTYPTYTVMFGKEIITTHNELFKAGKKIDAYLMFKKESKTTWSFKTYANKMKQSN